MLAARLLLTVTLAMSLTAVAETPAAPPAQPLATNKPFKVSAAAAQGPVFTVKSAVKGSGPDGDTTDVLLLRSRDGKVEMGLYEATASESDIAAYEDDEFMFFLAGGVKLTSADGSRYTAAVIQYNGDGLYDPHALYSQLDVVKHQYGCFLRTFLDGNATIVAPAAVGTPCQ